jgi:tetratricopeptide (TPR) repeat protein
LGLIQWLGCNLGWLFQIVLNQYSLIYTKLKQFEKAIQNYNQAIELNPKYADAFIDRGVAYADLEQFEKAIQDYIVLNQHKQDHGC